MLFWSEEELERFHSKEYRSIDRLEESDPIY